MFLIDHVVQLEEDVRVLRCEAMVIVFMELDNGGELLLLNRLEWTEQDCTDVVWKGHSRATMSSWKHGVMWRRLQSGMLKEGYEECCLMSLLVGSTEEMMHGYWMGGTLNHPEG